MTTPTTIAIVGATRPKGVAVARELARNRCRLVLMSDDHAALGDLNRKLAGAPAEILIQDCAKNACWEADVIILTLREADALTLTGKIKEVATGKILIYVHDHQEKDGLSFSDHLSRIMPFTRIVETTSPSLATEWAIDKRNQYQQYYQVQLVNK